MSLDCISCQVKRTSRLKSTGSFKARTLATLSPTARISAVGKLKPNLSKRIGLIATLTVDGDFQAKSNMSFGLDLNIIDSLSLILLKSNIELRIFEPNKLISKKSSLLSKAEST
jgi:hypothetical protein